MSKDIHKESPMDQRGVAALAIEQLGGSATSYQVAQWIENYYGEHSYEGMPGMGGKMRSTYRQIDSMVEAKIVQDNNGQKSITNLGKDLLSEEFDRMERALQMYNGELEH